jgi:spoIIIJ-associated protein
MADVEGSGKTVEEAIENALAEMGATREDVDVEVLSEGRAGVLGIGGEEARVVVRPRDGGSRPQAFEEVDGEEEAVEDEAEYAARMLDALLELMHVRADVSIRDAETPGDGLGMAVAVLDVEGDDLGILIGRRGETLASLQYLLNLMVNQQLQGQHFFTVDVEGYRRRRERALTSLAKRMAEQVKRTRRPVMLEPMPANERRIVHLALSEDRYVSTSSVGEGDDRKVEIALKARV